MEDLIYKVETKKSKCCKCGKTIKNVYNYKGEEYGYCCFMKMQGIEIDKSNSKQKPLPTWIFELLNLYEEYKIKENDIEKNHEDYECNFWNEKIGDWELYYPKNGGGVYCSTVKINGKSIPMYWQFEMAKYLEMRHRFLTQNKKEEN